MITNSELKSQFSDIFTPQIADACVRLGINLRIIGGRLRPLIPNRIIIGRALPVQHFGSVDIFFEAMDQAEDGDILVIDNEGREDEGCIGDLTAVEARSSGIKGFIINGMHRDTLELKNMNFQIFSYGSYPAGPTRVDSRTIDAIKYANFDGFQVTRQDFAFCDDDGVVFVGEDHVLEVIEVAKTIRALEKIQFNTVIGGKNMRTQLEFTKFLRRREKDQSFTFRQHLREIGRVIEE